MSLFVCPLCGGALEENARSYICGQNHVFDVASEGYVNLLPANRKHAKQPGDDRDMVRARNRFLSQGFYSPLRDALSEHIAKKAPEPVAFLDCGCGEGYYISGIVEALTAAGKAPCAAGIDISKSAVRLAAKRLKTDEFAVASCYHLPLADETIDVLLNCFSPLALAEFRRVLKPGGSFYYVVPAPKHLWEMKEILYDAPYENPLVSPEYDGFARAETFSVTRRVLLPSQEILSDLFTMTPYLWKTPRTGIERLNARHNLEVETSFDIHIYQKM